MLANHLNLLAIYDSFNRRIKARIVQKKSWQFHNFLPSNLAILGEFFSQNFHVSNHVARDFLFSNSKMVNFRHKNKIKITACH